MKRVGGGGRGGRRWSSGGEDADAIRLAKPRCPVRSRLVVVGEIAYDRDYYLLPHLNGGIAEGWGRKYFRLRQGLG